MPNATSVQASFAGGQWSQFAQGRFGDKRYGTALNVCLNGIPLETENWVRRPGTSIATIPRSGKPARAIKFDFEEVTPPYSMIFTDGFLQFISGTQSVTSNDSTAVSAISSANPAAMTLGTAVTWATGDQGYFSGLASNPLIENRLLALTKIDTTHFTLTDAVTGANINGSTLSAIGSNAVFNRVLAIATPYLAGAWSSLRAVQSDAIGVPVSFLFQQNVQPYAVTVTNEPSLGQFATLGFAAATFSDGPYLDPFSNGVWATPSAKLGVIALTLSFQAYSASVAYTSGDFVTSSSVNYQSLVDQNVGNTPASSPSQWNAVAASTAINNGQGFLTSDIGRFVRLYSEPNLWAVGSTYSIGGTVSYNPSGLPDQVTYWTSLTNSNTGNVPGTDIVNWQLLEQGGASSPALWSWGKITSLVNLISGTISGVAQIGNMTGGGGLAAAFDGTTNQNAAASAQLTRGVLTGGYTAYDYVGQNYAGCSPAAFAVQSATVFPSTDKGFVFASAAGIGYVGGSVSAVAYLYASNSLPSTYNNGTLMGSTSLGSMVVPNNGVGVLGTSAASIISSNQVTTYAYWWVVIIATFSGQPPAGYSLFSSISVQISQVQFVQGTSASSGNGVDVEILGAPLLYTTPIRTWRMGVYSTTTGWPQVGTWTDGRLWMSGAIPNRVDACCSNGVTVDPAGASVNFAPTDQYGNVLDSSGLSIVMNLPEANPILWMLPDQQGVIIGTKAREALIFPPTAGGFTPTNIDVRQTTQIGSADIEPRHTEHTIAFVQKYLRGVKEYFADVFSGKFTAPNLIKDAKSLSIGGIQEIAYQQELAPIIWARVNNGLIGCTYIRDTLMTSSGPTINGWHAHTLGSGRAIESICTGSSVNGNLDALTMVTNDTTANVRFVEVLSDILDEGSQQSAARYLDAAITPSSTAAVAIGAGFPYGGLQLNGLWPLNGKTVTAWLGGLDCGDYAVSNGSISVPYGDGIGGGLGSYPTPATNRYDQGLFTSAFVSTGITANGVTMFTGSIPMLVGFSFTSRGQLLRTIQPAETGSRNGPAFGKLTRGHYLMALFEGAGGGAGGVQLGYGFGDMQPALFKGKDENTDLTVDQQFSGVFRDQFPDDYTFDSRPAWQISRPQICNLQAIGTARETADV